MESDPSSERAETAPAATLFFRSRYLGNIARVRWSWQAIFPQTRLVPLDYAIAAAVLIACFFSFANVDLDYLGKNSLNYLFGSPLDFYENAKKYQPAYGGATYPPTLYLVFAVWLYPWKLLGVITRPDYFPPYLVYWLKLATSITYLAASYTFYHIAKEYFPEGARARYATAAWFTAPLAVFSQFVFAQTDIFHVALMLVGYLLMIRGRLTWLLEKRVGRVAGYLLLVAAPTLLVQTIYAHSPAFISNPINQLLIERLYVASITATDDRWWIDGSLRIYLLPLAYFALSALSYFRKVLPETRLRDCAYIWLTSSVLLFVPILWHPQWLILAVPAMTLTSMMSDRLRSFLVLDLLGMAVFVGALSFIFEDSADALMFRGDLLGIDFHNSYLMDRLFNWFGDHSANVFYTGFSAYLLLQIVLNYGLFARQHNLGQLESPYYGDIRLRLYIGLALFLVPAVFAIRKDLTWGEVVVQNAGYEQEYPLTSQSTLEQSFMAQGRAIKSVSVLLRTWGRRAADDLSIELVDAEKKVLARETLETQPTHELSWHRFSFPIAVDVRKDSQYLFRVLSAKGSPGNAFSTLALGEDFSDYKDGHVIIDGNPQTTELTFRIEFLR
jgi:hypothetical protein